MMTTSWHGLDGDNMNPHGQSDYETGDQEAGNLDEHGDSGIVNFGGLSDSNDPVQGRSRHTMMMIYCTTFMLVSLIPSVLRMQLLVEPW